QMFLWTNTSLSTEGESVISPSTPASIIFNIVSVSLTVHTSTNKPASCALEMKVFVANLIGP
ncbi:hypothetical protein QP246_11305, partial [Aerococcus urinae]